MGVRQRRVVGAVVKIPIEGRHHGYAWTLPEVDVAVFDFQTDADLPAVEVVRHPVAFRVAVNNSAFSSGRWPRVGKVTPPAVVLAPVPTFIQDPISGRFSIYVFGAVRPATRAECVGLERAAVWAPDHIEDRLRDHLAGRANVWVESLTMSAAD